MNKIAQPLIVFLLTAALILPFAGCSSKSPAAPSASPSGNTPPSESSAVSDDVSDNQGGPAGSTETASSPNVSGAKDYLAVGDKLMQTDGIGSIKINMTESDIVKALGQPNSKTAPKVWGSDGLEHSTWSYNTTGLQLDMTRQPGDSTSIVFSITASAPCTMATQRGVGLGTSKDKVLSLYADSIDDSANPDTSAKILIGSVYGGMIMDISSGVVSRIFIGVSAE